jgi:hypothetical protein
MMTNNRKPDYWIPGINLIVLVIYMVLSKVFDAKDGWGIVTIFIIVQVLVCLIASIVCAVLSNYKQLSSRWLLSFLLVLIIGFSTCSTIFDIRI